VQAEAQELLIADRYEDQTQIQSPQPIWPQGSAPTGIHNVELSWDRFCRHDGGYMRVVFRDLADDPDAKVRHPHHGFIKNGKQYGGWAHPYTWWFKQFLGRCEVLSTNNEKGRINMRASAVLNGETLILDRDPEAKRHPLVTGPTTTPRVKTHNRLCYRRAREDWRLRDERTGNLVFCDGYVGDMFAEWSTEDPIGHIYHKGATVMERDLVSGKVIAHLYDPLLS